MNKNVIIGLMIGCGLIFLFMPFFLVYGLTDKTALILYYMIPVSGALTGLIVSKYDFNFLGKQISFRYNNTNKKGFVKHDGKDILILNDGKEDDIIEKEKMVDVSFLDQ